MTHREHFFSVIRGDRPSDMPFMPDITDWYVAHRTPPGEARRFEPGKFIPDDDPIHDYAGTMPEPFRDFTLLDFHREFDWGFFAHIYDWYGEYWVDGVERVERREGDERSIVFHTPKGTLRSSYRLASNGTWSPREHFVKSTADMDIMAAVVDATRFTPRYDRARAVMDGLGERGVGDTVIFTSPFGKLVHDYMGFEQVVYALADEPEAVHAFLALQEEKDMELVRLACGSPETPVIISDHPDEYLIAPPYYERYCIPFYRRANGVLHEAGKVTSTHLDGNFRGFFHLLGDTGMDYLDGCTPAPMFNFEVEELAAALPEGMSAFCGVPSTLFRQGVPTEDILAFGDRIISSLRGRGIINVGDILPPDGDIGQVIALGEHVRSTWG